MFTLSYGFIHTCLHLRSLWHALMAGGTHHIPDAAAAKRSRRRASDASFRRQTGDGSVTRRQTGGGGGDGNVNRRQTGGDGGDSSVSKRWMASGGDGSISRNYRSGEEGSPLSFTHTAASYSTAGGVASPSDERAGGHRAYENILAWDAWSCLETLKEVARYSVDLDLDLTYDSHYYHHVSI